MKLCTDLFFLPITLPCLESQTVGERTMTLINRNIKQIAEIIPAERSYFFKYEGLPSSTKRGECSDGFPMLALSGEHRSTRETLFQSIDFAARSFQDRGQVCLFASPMLSVLEDRFLGTFHGKATRERNPIATVEAAGKHPCLLLRIEENPKDFPYNYNYRYHRLEIPGLLRMDERGENIVSIKDNKPLYRRQDYPPILVMNHALTALPFSRLKDYHTLLSSGDVRAFVMERADAILCRDKLDLYLASKCCYQAAERRVIISSSAGPIRTVEANI